jgi:N-formylglutamate deformylase
MTKVRCLRDTDWHIEDLYRDLIPGLTVVQATFHRYVIDANRDPSGQSLYPGASTTELVPTTTFDGTPIWQAGQEPTAEDIAHRLATFHAPYHAALAAEMERVRARHGVAILYDCHSIRSVIPWLFEGTCRTSIPAPTTAPPAMPLSKAAVAGRSRSLATPTSSTDASRVAGPPATMAALSEGLHAIQMELAQSSHLATEAPPFALDASKTASLRPILARMLTRLTDLAPTLAQKR